MYRPNGKVNKHSINILHSIGGLGDNIASLPVVEYILKYYPRVTPILWVPDFFHEFAKRSLSKGAVVKKFSDRAKYNQNLPSRHNACKEHSNLSYHMTDHAFNVILNRQVQACDKNYLPVDLTGVNIVKFALPEKYVVVTTGFTSEVREWLPEYINEVVRYIIKSGYTPVFLGQQQTFNGYAHTIEGVFKEEIDFSAGMNLIDKTTLLEATAIIYGAKCVVGLDNGLLHVAGTHPTLPIVGGFTTVAPEHRMPYRNNVMGYNYYPVVPPASLECRFCQSNMVFEFTQSFTKCFYGQDDKQCTKDLHPLLYINELKKIL